MSTIRADKAQQSKDAMSSHLKILDASYYQVWRANADKHLYVAGTIPVASLVAIIEACRELINKGDDHDL